MSGPQMVPMSVENENALLSACLINPSAMDTVALEPSDFYIQRNSWIWDAMLSLKNDKREVDFITVTNLLDERGLLADIGGASYITKVMNSQGSSMHADSYADDVLDDSTRRQTLRYANQLAKLAYDETVDIIDARAQVAGDLTNVRGKGGAIPVRNLLSKGFDMLQEVQANPGLLAGLSTGLPELDMVMGDGLLPGMTLLLGETGLGKSILAQQIATNLTRQGIPGAFYAGEMHWQDMYLRLMGDWAGLKVSDLRSGDINWPTITRVTEEMQNLPLFFDDPKNMTTSELRADLTRLKAEHGVKWMVFDFLDDLKDAEGTMKDWQRSAILATRVQDILVDLNIRGLVVHEVTKDGIETPGKAGIAGDRKVGYRAICAVQILPYLKDGEMEPVDYRCRTIKNIKQNRLVEDGIPYCDLYKDPTYPRFMPLDKKNYVQETA